jgi:hypothetical protein
MNTPVERVSSWQITLSHDAQEIILRPWVGEPGGAELPAQHFALTLHTARMLHRQLAESIRVLDQQNADPSGAIERRKDQQPVQKNRRKARHFEGSPSARSNSEPAPGEPKAPDADN